MSPHNVFRVIGYTRENILAGGAFGVMGLSMIALRQMGELHQHFGPLAIAAQQGRVVKEDGQVYFLSPLVADGGRDIYDQVGDQYQVIYFFDDSAFRICAENHIVLPPVIRETTRGQLPQGLGVATRFPN